MDDESEASMYIRFHLECEKSLPGNQTVRAPFALEIQLILSTIFCHYGPFETRTFNTSNGIYEQKQANFPEIDVERPEESGLTYC